jgi:hypothetical protein
MVYEVVPVTGVLVDRPLPPLRNRRGRIRCYHCPEWAVRTEIRPTSWSAAEVMPVCHGCSHEGGLEEHFGLPWSDIQKMIRS